MTSSDRQDAQLYQVMYLGTGAEPETRTVVAEEVAAVIEQAGRHGMKVLVRPCVHPQDEPGPRKGVQLS
ncbi:hypothetical protein [Streptomyces sp. NBC_01233]|uniref:hypothetical protein n=1 Tax=Streptomyces sp. NBC_01233 TaxID=2903787 RepID=UPI002E0E77D8|nr:hypothetical protein OG332_20425 [Streptomyces sp. NBC_01233]